MLRLFFFAVFIFNGSVSVQTFMANVAFPIFIYQTLTVTSKFRLYHQLLLFYPLRVALHFEKFLYSTCFFNQVFLLTYAFDSR